MSQIKSQQILEMVEDRGMVRPRELAARGISPKHLQRLYERGLLLRSGRGVYHSVEAELDENASLIEVGLRVPGAVICLLSALQYYDLTTQFPHQVWIALPLRAHTPRLDYPPPRVAHFSGDALTAGIEDHLIRNVNIRIYSPAKTVADCFKFRNKIGLDVALEALRDCWTKRRATMDELWHYAEICRVANVMRPYLESVGL